jgi:hypothetical protein
MKTCKRTVWNQIIKFTFLLCSEAISVTHLSLSWIKLWKSYIVEFEGVSIRLADLDHVKWRRDFKNLIIIIGMISGYFSGKNCITYHVTRQCTMSKHTSVAIASWPFLPGFSPCNFSWFNLIIVIRIMFRLEGNKFLWIFILFSEREFF